MKKLLMGLVLVLAMSIGINAADKFEFSFGPSFYFVPNYTSDAGIHSQTTAKIGGTVQFTFNFDKHWAIAPALSGYWYEANLTTYSPYFKASATTHYYLFDVDAKYVFNPNQAINVYAIAGPTWFYGAYSTLGADQTASKLGYNVGLGVSFPVVKPQYRILVEAKYYGLPDGIYPNPLANGSQNNFNISALFGVRF